MNTKTIEAKSINKLTDVINESAILEHNINQNDKEVSWDGNILLYKENTGEFSKKALLARIPIQLKGKEEKNKTKFNKNSVKFQVEIEDLNNYYQDGGVLYFLVYLCDNEYKIFYNILYPTKIKDILEKAKTQKVKHTIGIKMDFLKNTEHMEKIVKQSKIEFEKQGSGNNSLVQNAIDYKNLPDISSILFTTHFSDSIEEVLAHVNSGDISLYAKLKDSNIEFPIKYGTKLNMHPVEQINKPIKIDDNIYFNNVTVAKIDENIDEYHFGKCITFTMNKKITNNSINFIKKGTCEDVLNACDFMIHYFSKGYFNIENEKYEYLSTNYKDSKFFKVCNYYFEMLSLLKSIHFDLQINIDSVSDNDFGKIELLVNTVNRKADKIKLGKYMLTIANKTMPIIIGEIENEITIINVAQKNNLVFEIKDSEGITEKLPIFGLFGVNDLVKIDNYDADYLIEQCENADYCANTLFNLNLISLNFLMVYDIKKDLNYLKAAKIIIIKILEKDSNEIYKINYWQIKKRENILNNSDLEKIEKLEKTSSNNMIKCACHILLNNTYYANKLIEKMSPKDREAFESYPIISLLNQ